jgi:hypothetical protein
MEDPMIHEWWNNSVQTWRIPSSFATSSNSATSTSTTTSTSSTSTAATTTATAATTTTTAATTDDLIKHRTNGPSVLFFSGYQEWYFNNKLGRSPSSDGPAIIHPEAIMEYFVDGVRHRSEERPAIININGSRAYFENGQPHRLNGPAIICSNGQKEWWQYGVLHRPIDEGPAIIYSSGNAEWWLQGTLIAIYQKKKLYKRKEKHLAEFANEIDPSFIILKTPEPLRPNSICEGPNNGNLVYYFHDECNEEE